MEMDRPAVTVAGTIYVGANGGVVYVNNMQHVERIGVQDGDEVEVTIRKHERGGRVWPGRGRGGATEEETSELGIEPDGY